MKTIPAATIQQPQKVHPCDHCYQSRFCLPIAIPQDKQARMREIMQNVVHLAKGERLFTSQGNARRIYAVHVGSFKSVMSMADGRQQVVGFYVPGELMGLENFATRDLAIDVVAMEESEACEIDIRNLEIAAREIATLQHQLHCIIGNRLTKAQEDQFSLGSAHAEERLARFLLDLARRYKSRGLSPHEFTLHMSRDEIASYLGLKMETVSRLLSRFHREGIIEVNVRYLRITNRDAMSALLIAQDR